MNPDFGLKIGTVIRPKPGGAGASGGTKIDPNCVTVRIMEGIDAAGQPIYKEVTARVLASFAGSTSSEKVSYGSVIIPQDGEQVLVGYLDGNSQGEAYILGSVFQGTVKPPYDISKDVAGGDTKAGESMVIKLKNGTQISINNVSTDATSIVITTGGNNRVIKLIDKKKAESFLQISDNAASPQTYLKMDFKSGAIECKAGQKMTLAAGKGDQGSIVIDGNTGNVTIGNKKGNIVIDSKVQTTIKGAQMAIEGTSQTNVKGKAINVGDGSGMVGVKGGTVQIGTMVKLG